eukprot:Rhum_TRINITY_DN13733_c0_g1::Rhum_TRINITY_DN13733_c0_g1_i1::g.63464::m.63464
MDGLEICTMMGSLLKSLTDDVKELKAWRDEVTFSISEVEGSTERLDRVCNEITLRQMKAQKGLLKTQAQVLYAKQEGMICKQYWHRLDGYRRLQQGKVARRIRSREVASTLFGTTRVVKLSHCFDKWYVFYRRQRLWKQKLQKQISLAAVTDGGVQLLFFTKLQKFARQEKIRRACVERLSSRSESSTMQLYFNTLARFSQQRRKKATLQTALSTLASGCENTCRGDHFRKLRKFVAVSVDAKRASAARQRNEQLRAKAVSSLLWGSTRGLFKEHFRLWAAWLAGKKAVLDTIETLATTCDTAARSNYYRKLRKYVAVAQGEKQVAEAARRRALLTGKSVESLLWSTTMGTRLLCFKVWRDWTFTRRSANIRELVVQVEMNLKKTQHELEARVSALKERADTVTRQERAYVAEAIKPVMRNVHDVENMVLTVSRECKAMKDEQDTLKMHGDASLREAMGEVDVVLSKTREDLVSLSQRSSVVLQEHAASVSDDVSEKMCTLEMNMANLLSADRDCMKLELRQLSDGVQERLTHLTSQSDMSLKSLSNTNTVLNKVVDRMMTIDKELERVGGTASGERRSSETDSPPRPRQLESPRSDPAQTGLSDQRAVSPERLPRRAASRGKMSSVNTLRRGRSTSKSPRNSHAYDDYLRQQIGSVSPMR